MLEWLQHIVEQIQTAFESVGGLIKGIISGFQQFFAFLKTAIEFVTTSLSLVPTVYYVFGVITITILIALVITGRNAGGD